MRLWSAKNLVDDWRREEEVGQLAATTAFPCFGCPSEIFVRCAFI